MVKYLLVEDERFAYEELKRMMQRLRPSWQLAGWAESVEQAVLLLRQGSLDLMIVDIRLSDGLSFEIFEQCPVDLPVIFTTAYDEYAIRAFTVNRHHHRYLFHHYLLIIIKCNIRKNK